MDCAATSGKSMFELTRQVLKTQSTSYPQNDVAVFLKHHPEMVSPSTVPHSSGCSDFRSSKASMIPIVLKPFWKQIVIVGVASALVSVWYKQYPNLHHSHLHFGWLASQLRYRNQIPTSGFFCLSRSVYLSLSYIMLSCCHVLSSLWFLESSSFPRSYSLNSYQLQYPPRSHGLCVGMVESQPPSSNSSRASQNELSDKKATIFNVPYCTFFRLSIVLI